MESQLALDAIVEVGILLLALASIVAILTKYVRLPYSVLLVIVGFFVGRIGFLAPLHIKPEVVMVLFLPPLLFESAIHINFAILRRLLKFVILFALPGVILCALLIALLMHIAVPLPLASLLVFGAIVSATDPLSVISLFKENRVAQRISLLVEGESLFNDATAVVLFRVLIGFALAGALTAPMWQTVNSGLVSLTVMLVGGIAVGLTLGLAFSKLFQQVDDHLIEITMSVILAYLTYLAAEFVHVSGVIAVVVVGLVIGNYGMTKGMTVTTRVPLLSFWGYVAFVVNSLIFILIGIEVNKSGLTGFPLWEVGFGFLVVLVARALTVTVFSWLGNRFGTQRVRANDQAVLIWGGVKGSLSMALALSLPLTLTARSELINLVFGVVVLSLLVQGLTMRPLLKMLGLAGRVEEDKGQYERIVARMVAAQRAIAELERLKEAHTLPRQFYQKFYASLEETVHQGEAELAQLLSEKPQLAADYQRTVQLAVLHARKAALAALVRDGLVHPSSVREQLRSIDDEIFNLTS